MSHELTITKGTCFALFAYDVGLDINLTDAERRFLAGSERGRLRHKTGAPQYVEYRPAPLRLVQEGSVFDVSQYSPFHADRCSYFFDRFDETAGCSKLSRILPAGHAFPYDFGSIPGTRGEDGGVPSITIAK
jgi:hypothetical protein